MSDLPVWAKDKARKYFLAHHWAKESAEQLVPSLARLLMEVSEESATIQYHKREALLAEVRRVVESTVGIAHPQREILARLEKL